MRGGVVGGMLLWWAVFCGENRQQKEDWAEGSSLLGCSIILFI